MIAANLRRVLQSDAVGMDIAGCGERQAAALRASIFPGSNDVIREGFEPPRRIDGGAGCFELESPSSTAFGNWRAIRLPGSWESNLFAIYRSPAEAAYSAS